MKNIAILVIAATNQPIYIHYLKNYWTAAIAYTNAQEPNVDIFLLFENNANYAICQNLEDNIIQDKTANYDALCDPAFQNIAIPGILSKTIYALEQLQNRYDVFFRTNLSSVLRIHSFNEFVQNKTAICYSGALVWSDALRQDLILNNKIGANKSIGSLDELAPFESNTFISGSAYFLNAGEAKNLVDRKSEIRFDIIDDVSVGLMCPQHELLSDFSVTLSPETPTEINMRTVMQSKGSHIRLEHFPVDKAELLWNEMCKAEVWRR